MNTWFWEIVFHLDSLFSSKKGSPCVCTGRKLSLQYCSSELSAAMLRNRTSAPLVWFLLYCTDLSPEFGKLDCFFLLEFRILEQERQQSVHNLVRSLISLSLSLSVRLSFSSLFAFLFPSSFMSRCINFSIEWFGVARRSHTISIPSECGTSPWSLELTLKLRPVWRFRASIPVCCYFSVLILVVLVWHSLSY